jgi:hypothetical protein
MSTQTMDKLNSSVLCAHETRSTSQNRQGPDKREGRHEDFPPPKKASQALLLGNVRRLSMVAGRVFGCTSPTLLSAVSFPTPRSRLAACTSPPESFR